VEKGDPSDALTKTKWNKNFKLGLIDSVHEGQWKCATALMDPNKKMLFLLTFIVLVEINEVLLIMRL
jgi:hypothetical protein